MATTMGGRGSFEALGTGNLRQHLRLESRLNAQPLNETTVVLPSERHSLRGFRGQCMPSVNECQSPLAIRICFSQEWGGGFPCTGRTLLNPKVRGLSCKRSGY